jgi:hypothetical protein
VLAQSVVDEPAERLVSLGGASLELGENLRVDGQGGAHDGLHGLSMRLKHHNINAS